MRAVLGGITVAESDETIVVEGNHYFPPESIKKEYFVESNTASVCPWKGNANYLSAVVNGTTYKDIAWVYRNPKPEAAYIKNHVAFWKEVDVID